MANTPSWIVPAPKSNTGTTPSWVVKAPVVNSTSNNTQFDPTKKGTHEDVYGLYAYGRPTGGNVGGEGSFATGELDPQVMADWEKDNPNHKYFTEDAVWSGGEGGSMTTQKNVDWASLPNQGNTKYGRIGENAATIKSLDAVQNPNAMYFDPAYGWVTPKSNLKQSTMNKVMGNGAMIAGLAMGGLMGAALPAGAITSAVKYGFKALPSLASGSFDPVSLGLGALGAGGYVPSWVVPAANTARQGYSWITQQGKG